MTFPKATALLALVLSVFSQACGAPVGDADAGNTSEDAGAVAAVDSGTPVDSGSPADAGVSLDSGIANDAGANSDAGMTVDAGSPCGNGIIEAGELCDSDSVACSTLAASYASGTAHCRSDCGGYTVAADCQLDTAVTAEIVRPKIRSAGTRWNDAVCNDGTPFVFNISLSPTGSKDWVIYLQGGGFCDGVIKDCHPGPDPLRDPDLVSSMNDAADRATVGAMPIVGAANELVVTRDPLNTTFRNANFVYGRYCSSDIWGGTRTDTIEVQPGLNYVFAGRRNFKSMMEVVRQRYGLDDSDAATRILLTGSSAGGNGTRNNADIIAHMMPGVRAARKIWVAPQAGFMSLEWKLDPPGTVNSRFTTDARFTMGGLGKSDREIYAGGPALYQTEVSAECTALAAAAGEASSVCASGLWGAKTLLTPQAQGGLGLRLFEYQSREDTVYAIGLHNLGGSPATLVNWDALIGQELAQSGVRWLFSPNNKMHGLNKPTQVKPFPAFSAASSPTCQADSYPTGTTYYSMLTDFWNDAQPDTSHFRVCFNQTAGWP